MPSSGNSCPIINTGDPNWQATKSTVRERNAAMFNNELMADISFIVGSDGEFFVVLEIAFLLVKGATNLTLFELFHACSTFRFFCLLVCCS